MTGEIRIKKQMYRKIFLYLEIPLGFLLTKRDEVVNIMHKIFYTLL